MNYCLLLCKNIYFDINMILNDFIVIDVDDKDYNKMKLYNKENN